VRDSMMAANLLALAERGPALVHAHNLHLQRAKSTMRMGGMQPEWWSAGAIVSVRQRPRPGGPLHPERRALGRGSQRRAPGCPGVPWYGYSPLDPANIAGTDGIVFVKDALTTPCVGG
jgi:hypothetical protein